MVSTYLLDLLLVSLLFILPSFAYEVPISDKGELRYKCSTTSFSRVYQITYAKYAVVCGGASLPT